MQKNNSRTPIRVPGAEIAEQSLQSGYSVVKSGHASLRVVVFTLAGHEHCVDVRRVREIIMAPRLSTVIESPHFVDGVIEVRGKIVPVIDLRRRLQVAEAVDSHEDSVVMIAQFGKDLAGFRVDSVSEILTVPTRLIEPPTRVVGGVKTSFIDGLAYVGSRFLVFLNLDAVLSPEEESRLGRSCFGRTEESDQEAAQTAVTGFKRIITFQLDKETYGAEIGEVAEIMEMVPIMPIPHVPPLILGLVNVRWHDRTHNRPQSAIRPGPRGLDRGQSHCDREGKEFLRWIGGGQHVGVPQAYGRLLSAGPARCRQNRRGVFQGGMRG